MKRIKHGCSFLVVAVLVMLLSLSVASSVDAVPFMYWTDTGTDKIQRADLDGNNMIDLVTTGLSSPRGIALQLDSISEPIPEPATIALLGIGLAGLAGAVIRRKRKKKAVDKS